jgi:A/G-specific adenine glycosylase
MIKTTKNSGNFEASKFRSALLDWFQKNARDLPWRRTTEPYLIWLSEMMCQQTGIKTVIPYFERFVEKFPTLESLAKADEEEVLRLWEGLGYYSRARNLHRAARLVAFNLKGNWPKTREDILKLPGVGEYSAGAILSIAFSKAEAALDGNVIRVLSRIFRYEEPVDNTKSLKHLWALARDLVPPEEENRRNYTEAMMELGARICCPREALCNECPVSSFCESAFQSDACALPKKANRRAREKCFEVIYVPSDENKFPVLPKGADPKFPLFRRIAYQPIDQALENKPMLQKLKYSVTHRDFEVFLIRGKLPKDLRPKVEWVPLEKMGEQLLPAIDRKLLKFLSKA